MFSILLTSLTDKALTQIVVRPLRVKAWSNDKCWSIEHVESWGVATRHHANVYSICLINDNDISHHTRRYAMYKRFQHGGEKREVESSFISV